MTRGLQRATFNRSALVRVLSDHHPEAPDPKYDFGERLGQWLDLADALTLYSVLNAEAGAATPIPDDDIPDQLERVRRNLSESIRNNGLFSVAPAGAQPATPPRIPFPLPPPHTAAGGAADFAPYHRYYLAHQRDMTVAIAELRATARKALAGRSAASRKLAALDAAFEGILAARERNLLTNIPTLLAKRFDRLYAPHRADDPVTWTQPGSWLEAFCHDAQAVLLAELELRLKPVAGLIAALVATPGSASATNETKPQ